MANARNKSQFINLLNDHLEGGGFRVLQSINDADTKIVQTALDIVLNENVNVVADDTDVLVLLLHHFQNEMKDVFFYSEASKRSKEGHKIFRIRSLRLKMNPIFLKNSLLIHAWSGCDTTSATFGQEKV